MKNLENLKNLNITSLRVGDIEGFRLSDNLMAKMYENAEYIDTDKTLNEFLISIDSIKMLISDGNLTPSQKELTNNILAVAYIADYSYIRVTFI